MTCSFLQGFTNQSTAELVGFLASVFVNISNEGACDACGDMEGSTSRFSLLSKA